VDTWTEKNGLPQNEVFAITQTSDGYLWLGTPSGLTRFDGTDFKLYEDKDIPGLNGSKIVKLFEDSHGGLWIGTEAAGVLLVGRQGKVSTVLPAKGSVEGPLVGICEDGVGGIWLRMAKGQLYRYWDGGARPLAVDCRNLACDDSGKIWLGTPDNRLVGLGPISTSTSTAIGVSYDLPVNRLDFLLSSKRGGYWRLADGRVQKYRADLLEKGGDLGPYPWRLGTPILAACEDRDGNLVVGTYGDGVYWFDAAGTPTRLVGLSHSFIWSLAVDREGALWVGTDGSGLNRVKRNVFEVLDGTAGSTVQSVCEGHQGGLWIGYNGEHVDHSTQHGLQQFTTNFVTGGSFKPNVRSVFEDRAGTVWVGAASEFGLPLTNVPCLFRFQTDHFEPVSEIYRDVAAIFQDREGLLWFGTQGGLVCWDQRQWKTFTTHHGLSADSVRAITEDAEGNLWVGTERGGLNRLTNGKFTIFRKQDKDGLPSDSISSLYCDSEGILWVGTSSGLARHDHGKWTRYTTQDGLHSNKIGYLVEDTIGYLWIGSNSGLMRVSRHDLTEVARGTSKWVTCRTFGAADGLPTGECTSGSQPGACRTAQGKLWFPTILSLAGVDPGLLHPNTNPPPVVIEAVRIDNQLATPDTLRTPQPRAVTVPADKEALEIDFTSLNLSAPDKGRFRFQLIGHEKAPAERPTRDRSVRYIKLPPADYEFHVTACNEDGVWNPTGATLAVKVLPAFWQTRWFLLLMSVGVLALISGSVYYVSTQKLQRQVALLRHQEALEKERARIARDLHDQLGANLTQVALLGEMAETDKNLPAEVETHARQISQTARETTHALDEIVWTVNPSNDTLDGLINYICKYAQEYLALAGLRYRLEAPPSLPNTPITPEFRHNVFLVAKEAVNNVVKHARASAAVIRFNLAANQLSLEIEDNGRGVGGLDEKAASTRNGLRNMRKRMEDVRGSFSIGPAPEGGTRVRLMAPLGKR
jgi:signal transduction histidine kinase/ligand-binding sensor domain-containing protein